MKTSQPYLTVAEMCRLAPDLVQAGPVTQDVTTSPFLWRGQPSQTGDKRKPDSKTYIPIPLTFSKRSHTSSIASAEKLKQRPGTGRSSTV